ncbi:MAG: hypothetical protein JSS32_07810 [Verrucomicrobia bacterium]|nr:hypothetical protein [Verrucomicrobiota bacterium]
MDEPDPYRLIREKLASLSAHIHELTRDSTRKEAVLKSIDQILEASQQAGEAKLHEDVEKLVAEIRKYLKHPADPKTMEQVLSGILRLRQDATEI